MKTKQAEELVLQSLEHEMGGVKIYEAAVACAVNSDLKEEWEKYLEQTRTHVSILEEICRTMKIDPKRRHRAGGSCRRWVRGCCRPWSWRSRAVTPRPRSSSPARRSS
jgi:hypothetical protein